MLILSQNKEIKDELSKIQFEMVTRVEKVEAEIENLKVDIGAVKTSQEFQNGRFETQKLIQENIQSNYIKQEKNILRYEKRIMDQEREALDEKLSRNYMENNSRKINLEITGIPAVADEDCKKIIYTLGKLIQVEDEHLNNIDVAHRLTNSNGKIPAIIVKFKSRTDRDKYFEK